MIAAVDWLVFKMLFAAMASADGWLCPHCYEEENPTAGLFCNSSICMRKSGRVPTGIAIFRAQALGFKSVVRFECDLNFI